MVAAQPLPGGVRHAGPGRLGRALASSHAVDAIPDLSENQVIVYADWPGRSPREVEDQVTYPLSVNLQAWRCEDGAGVVDVRVHVHHRDLRGEMDNYSPVARVGAAQLPGDLLRAESCPSWARRQRAGLGLSILPGGGPGALAKGGYDLHSCGAADWFIRYQLNAVQAWRVGSIGDVRQYQVEVSR